jgi:hypothetical protein
MNNQGAVLEDMRTFMAGISGGPLRQTACQLVMLVGEACIIKISLRLKMV